MPAQKIIDLSTVVGPPLKVRLQADGPVYKLPADLPVPLYLKVSAYGDAEMDEAEMAEDLYAELLELFQVHQPDLDELPIGMVALITAIPRIYGGGEPAEDEGGAPPSRAGTRSTKKARPKRSRSSRS